MTPPVTGMDCTSVPAVEYSSTYTALAVPVVMAAAPSPTRTTVMLVDVMAAPRADGRRERRRRRAAWGRGEEGWGGVRGCA